MTHCSKEYPEGCICHETNISKNSDDCLPEKSNDANPVIIKNLVIVTIFTLLLAGSFYYLDNKRIRNLNK